MSRLAEISQQFSYADRSKVERAFTKVLENIHTRQLEEKRKREITPQILKEIASYLETLQVKSAECEMLGGGWVGAFGATNAFLDIKLAKQVIEGKAVDVSLTQKKSAKENYTDMEEFIRIIYAGDEAIMIRQVRESMTLATVEYDAMFSKRAKKQSFTLDREGIILDQQTSDMLIHYFLRCLRDNVSTSVVEATTQPVV
jgi:hypothetical protein